MPEDDLRWIEKYRAALNQRTAKPRGLLEAIARALGLAVGRIYEQSPEGSPERVLEATVSPDDS